jgi:uncharacterized protein (TIGR02231 family)
VLVLSWCVHAAAAATEPPVLTPSFKITHVTVSANRADVRRIARDVRLRPGRNVVEVPDLPAHAEGGSIRTEGLADADVRLVHLDVQPSSRGSSDSLRAEIDLAEAAVRDLEARKAGLGAGKEFLDSVRLARSGEAPSLVETDAAAPARLGATLAFLTGEVERNRAEHARVELAIERLRARLGELRRELGLDAARLRSWTARLELDADSEAAVDLVLMYATSGASWRPTYDIVVPEDLGAIRVVYAAEVTQSTGEDWDDVTVTLSTAQPELGARIPRLDPWWLAVPPPPEQVATIMIPPGPQDFARGGRSSEVVTLADEETMKIRRVDSKAESKLRAINTTEAIRGEGELAVSFGIPEPQTLPSDGRSRRVGIASFEVEGEFRHESAPKVEPHVFLVASVRNSSELPMLSGVTRVILGGAFLGHGHVDNAAPGERFPLSLGVDRAVTVKREVVRRRDDRSGSRHESEVALRIAITNGRRVPVTLTLRDQLPVSPDADVAVRVREVEPEPAGAASDDGLLEWTLEIPGGGRQDVDFGYLVRYPSDRRPANL